MAKVLILTIETSEADEMPPEVLFAVQAPVSRKKLLENFRMRRTLMHYLSRPIVLPIIVKMCEDPTIEMVAVVQK